MDNAVAHFGTSLEAELDAVEAKTAQEINRKRQRIMEKWLDMPRRFKSPMATKQDDVVHDITVKGGID